MSKYIRMTQTYLVLLTVFVLSRFILEAVGPEYISWLDLELELDTVLAEINIYRFFLVFPVFLGLRFVSESLGGWKEMVIANFTYVTWVFGLLIILHAVDQTLAIGTSYGRGEFIGTSIGEVYSWWLLHQSAGPPTDTPSQLVFGGSILSMGIMTNILCWITIKWNGRASAVEETSG